jgi:hypothetical protein
MTQAAASWARLAAGDSAPLSTVAKAAGSPCSLAQTIGCELAVLSSGWRFLNLTTPHAIGRPIGRTVGKDDMRRPNDQVVDEHSLTATAEVRVEQGCDR